MSQELRTQARFADLPTTVGHYESFYVKATDPKGGRAVWLRHTFHKRPGEKPTAAIWLTVFDSAAGPPRATKVSYEAGEISAPGDAYVKIGESVLDNREARGSAGSARWKLQFDRGAEILRHLDRDYFYRSKLPRTKLETVNPDSRFDGWIELDGQRLELNGWPGMVGHNWGTEHAQSWIWLQAAAFGERPGDYLDVALGRVKFLGRVTPWIPNGRIVLGGESYRIGGLRNVYGTEIAETPTGCEFTLPGKDVNVKGKVSAPARDFVAWIYADPEGAEHHAINCSVADIELRVERPDHRHAKLSASGTAVYELGTSETDHGIELQPFPDG